MAGRYASALFALAQEQSATDQVASDLARFSALMAESADLTNLVRSPVFTAEEQVKALGAVLDKAGISGLTAKFLKLVATKRRLFALPTMIADYGKLHDAARGVSRAEVTVAEALSPAKLDQLRKALADANPQVVTGKAGQKFKTGSVIQLPDHPLLVRNTLDSFAPPGSENPYRSGYSASDPASRRHWIRYP
jgi:F-type H+-transporting ATPase subunit delta